VDSQQARRIPDEEDDSLMASFFDLNDNDFYDSKSYDVKGYDAKSYDAKSEPKRSFSPARTLLKQQVPLESPISSYSFLEPPSVAATSTSPWPSAKEYSDIFRRFLNDPSSFQKYSTGELGLCKITGTPLQPSWIYTSPKAGMYFLQCSNLRGKGSFGFPKCEGIGKKAYEWKKTSYVNNVPKAKPIISYITANGNGKSSDIADNYRMRIIKALELDCANADQAQHWVLVDIHISDGLARRMGPRGAPKQPLQRQLSISSFESNATDGCASKQGENKLYVETKPEHKTLLAVNEASIPYIPLSPLKRLSLGAHEGFEYCNDGSPKGLKMQKMFY